MIRIPNMLNRLGRPFSTSALRFMATQESPDVDALFNAESGIHESQKRRPRPGNSINRVELMGGVADYPVERSSRTGNSYLSFNMFTNVEYRKPDGSFDENVELHNVLVFGNQLNYVRRNVQRGNRVFVTGRLHYSNGPIVAGQVSRAATVVADLIQVLAKSAPRQDSNPQEED